MSSLAYRLSQNSEENTEAALPQVRPRALKARQPAAPRCRESEAVSVFAIVGFLLACFMVVLVLLCHIRLDQINEQTTNLSAELSALEAEYEDLSAQYEQLFDMDSIKSNLMASGAMTQITSEQQIYMDLSQPDSTEVCEEDDSSGAASLINSAAAFLSDLFS